jgi:hypothetical protein
VPTSGTPHHPQPAVLLSARLPAYNIPEDLTRTRDSPSIHYGRSRSDHHGLVRSLPKVLPEVPVSIPLIFSCTM